MFSFVKVNRHTMLLLLLLLLFFLHETFVPDSDES